MLYDPTYSREGPDIMQEYKLTTGNIVRYSARDVRRENSGIHARVAIAINHVTLAWTTFNVERDEDRVRLANSAFKAWGKADLDQAEWPSTHMKKGLDLFCEGLWREVVSNLKGELLCGDPDLGAPELLVGSYVLHEGGSIIFAPPGRGKSYTAMLMAVSLDAGVETLWELPSGPRRCMYINLERGRESMQRRLTAVNRCLGLDPRRPLPFINARGKTLHDVIESAVETAQEYGIEVIWLDSISRTGYGDLTADRVVNAIMDAMNGSFPTWVALGHTPRGDETHAFGSQMFDAAADLTVMLSTQTSDDGFSTGIGLEVVKANDTPTGNKQIHVLEWNAGGLVGVRKARQGEYPNIEGNRKMEAAELAREYLLLVGEASVEDVARETGKDRTTIVKLMKNAGWAHMRKEGRKLVYSIKAPYETPRYE